MRELSKSVLAFLAKPKIALGGAALIALVMVGVAWKTSAVTPSGAYTRAALAPITAVGGANIDLSFQIPGQVAALSSSIGETVVAHAPLVELDQSMLRATRAGAVANTEAAQARLDALLAGTRPEQLAIDETNVRQAEAALYDTIRNAYITADDAIHNKADQLFINPRTAWPTLAFTPSDQALQNVVLSERSDLESMMNDWSLQLKTANRGQSGAASDPLAEAALAEQRLTRISTLLNDISTLLAETSASSVMPTAVLQGYQANITAARLAVSGSVSALTNGMTLVQGAQGILALAKAGPTDNDIAAARAAVDAAAAALRGIEVTLRESTLSAPVAGTVTALNAHPGQTVAPGQIIVSIETAGGSKASALIVPTSSIIQDAGQSFVYVQNGQGAPIKTLVTTGLAGANGMTEIVSGISAGTAVLTFGTAK
ncbi:biotin/lipoyl-binding protein [Patescibacteria group bacterium]|nr:biotin/lipoyl-binding protein [Patescibacteria group bacterium]